MTLLCTSCIQGIYHGRVTRARWEGGGIAGLHQVTHTGRWRLTIGALPPGPRSLKVAPHPLNRGQRWTIGWEPDIAPMLGPPPALVGHLGCFDKPR
jgi:hypothetical protein